MVVVSICGHGGGGNSESDAAVVMFDKYCIGPAGIITFVVLAVMVMIEGCCDADDEWVSYSGRGGGVNNPEGIMM